jgi:serine/threonine protein kinase/WD40 repeat protein
MAAIVCPGPQELTQFILGQSSAPSAEQVAEHIEACAPCQAALRNLSAEDTLVEAVRARETLPDGPEQESVRRLVARVRSILPDARKNLDQTIDSVTPPVSHPNDRTDPSVGQHSNSGVADEDGFAPPQEADEIGRLAGYRVLKVLGTGGMGKVYLAEDAQLQRKVALKVMKADLARNQTSRHRFLREARLAAAIEHDNIVHIYQVGEDRGVPFLAMQLLTGLSLEDVLKREGPMKIQQVLRIGIQIAEGLSAAHQRDLIHRDIKPANIWIEPTGGGRAKLLDFGLARSTSDDISLTQTGAIMGTPAYMAPEQARGEKVDSRADLYSLGCVLYRMTTADMPIKGTDTMAMLMALALDAPTPPLAKRPDVPSALSDLIMRLLAKSRDLRPANAQEVVNALRGIERALSSSAPGDTQPLSEPKEKPAPPRADPVPPKPAPPKATPVIAKPANPQPPKATPAVATPAKPAPPKPVPAPPDKTISLEAKSQSRTAPGKSSSNWKRWIAIGAAAVLLSGLLIAAGVFFIPTANGIIRIEVDDTNTLFKIDDKGEYTIVGSDGKEVKFAAGEHTLKFKNGDTEVETDKFTLKKNDKVVVKVEFLKGKLQVVQDDKVLSEKKIEPAGGAGTPIALKKGTWVPDKTTQALPGMIPYPALRQGIGRWQVITPAESGGPSAESPDGRWLAVWRRPYVLIYDAQTGALNAVGRETKAVTAHHLSEPRLEWSPDSKWFRTGFRRGDGWTDMQLFTLDGSLSPTAYFLYGHNDPGWNPKYPLVACGIETHERMHFIDPNKAKPVEVVTQHGPNDKAVWSPDGESLLVVRQDKTAQIFGRDGKPGAKLEGTVEPSPLPVWTADSSTIAALAGPETIRFWKKDGSGGATCKHDAAVKGLWWYAAAKLIVAADDKKMRFWTLDGAAHAGPDIPGSTAVSFVADGILIGQDFWSNLNQPAKKLPPNVALSPDGKYATIWHPGGSLGMAEIKDGEVVELDWRIPLLGGSWFSRDGKRLFVNDFKGLAAYDIRDAKKVTHFGGGSGPGGLAHCVLSPRGDKLAVASIPGLVTICDPLGQPFGKPLAVSDDPTKASNDHPGNFWHLSWHPDGRHLLAISGVGAVVFDVTDGKRVASLSQPPGVTAAFGPGDGDHIIFTSTNGSALWRWKHEREPSRRIDAVLGLPLPSPAGKLLICRGTLQDGSQRSAPHIVSPDLQTRTPLAQDDLKGGGYYAPAFCWLPDGKHLLAGTNPLSIRSVDGALVEAIKPVDGVNTQNVEKLQLSPDGKSIVGWSAGDRRFFRLNLADKKLSPLPGIGVKFASVHYPLHYGAAVFSPDSKYLIIPEESMLTYWNLATSELEQIVLLLPDAQHVIFSPAGEVLARSPKAEQYYRYMIEDRTGRLQISSPR